MPRAVSSEKIREYLRLRLGGYSNSQASSRVGFSSRTGTNHLKNIREKAGRSGLLSVVRSYGLEIDDLSRARDFYQATNASDLALILPGWRRMILPRNIKYRKVRGN